MKVMLFILLLMSVLFADGYMFSADGQGQWKPEETGREETSDLTPDYQDEIQDYINSLQVKKEEFSINFDPWNAYVSNDRGTQERLPPDEIPDIQGHWPDAPPPPDALGHMYAVNKPKKAKSNVVVC